MTIAATIKADITLDPSGWGELPEFPANLGTPFVTWGFDDGKIETNVTLTLDGEEETVSFWDTDQDGISNTAEDAFGMEGPTPWEYLEAEDFDAAIRWGKKVHARIMDAAQEVAEKAAPVDSEAYNAVIAYGTGTTMPDDERTPKEMALFRGGEALAVTGGITGSSQDDLQILMVDLLHLAEENGLDLHAALRHANGIFQLERNDAAFSTGI